MSMNAIFCIDLLILRTAFSVPWLFELPPHEGLAHFYVPIFKSPQLGCWCILVREEANRKEGKKEMRISRTKRKVAMHAEIYFMHCSSDLLSHFFVSGHRFVCLQTQYFVGVFWSVYAGSTKLRIKIPVLFLTIGSFLFFGNKVWSLINLLYVQTDLILYFLLLFAFWSLFHHSWLPAAAERIQQNCWEGGVDIMHIVSHA